MELRARILLIGDDDDLRLTRAMILRNEGYEVESVTSNAALKAQSGREFQVAIIGQSVSSARAMRLASSLRERYAEIRTLRIQETGPELGNVFDLTSETLAGPVAFLAAVRSLSERQLTQTED